MSPIEDRGQTDHVTALPRPYALDRTCDLDQLTCGIL